MRSGIFVAFVNILLMESVILARYVTEEPMIDQELFSIPAGGDNENSQEKIAPIKQYDDQDSHFEPETEKKAEEKVKKPCSIVVLSNIQNPNVQSLLRKYRYDANGILIPGSVKYFIKMPQGLKASPLLVPLNDKAFFPLGGFVRYYKEVPPIPQAW
ncbi:uncharacterized protein LOC119839593 [Zerene cesonia]|uniref:uncharacterized protein LOC119839593 n=1 Tax=Zerene cesonia TaxID=33412 RepID=UPI0018E52BEC|nr:uncharacterized protein LOC119839593 [Zerene cesonia]